MSRMRQYCKGSNLLMNESFKKIGLLFFLFIPLLIIPGCKEKEQYNTRSFYEMGTIVNVTLNSKDDKVIGQLNNEMGVLEKEITNFTEKINKTEPGRKIPVSKSTHNLLKEAEYYKNLSNGKFDITVATISSLYGFPEGPFHVPDNKTIQQKIKDAGFSNLFFDKNSLTKKTDLKIDMGAYAKGYIVDNGIEFLKTKGVESAMINAGGDLYALGNKNGRKWHVAIKDPDSKENFLSIIALKDKAVATSGNYERYFEENGQRYPHIFNAVTFKSVNNYKSISVIADSVEKSDGLATVYYLMNTDNIQKKCRQLKTPVLIYTKSSEKIKLCGWKEYEISN